ncbi:octanoyltransferase [Buchnera aphidicola (Schlechtendalia chinensis)]|uniref:Octanoyltransferase n=1 Tax=Buchnera aphidicola subsp. Schlechtendalia chinensis TaxID=118110 RepID=A0A172WDI4_BUCSC|nr:lipoyl(octanoyl) transferase LipB [Buchnera aphidicola]ANF17034.1 octanoyltransferase [Buchnera aphidicola (Schlechtendalia chinensis)]
MKVNIKIRNFGLRQFKIISHYMQHFTSIRNECMLDEIWLVQHYPVYTFGVNERKYSWKVPKNIPIIFSDRGGKTTYHGPGQIIVYFLLDLIRLKISISTLIYLIQETILSTLKYFSITAYVLKEFPGIYVDNKKICSFGLRIKKGCSFYGTSLNVDMDLSPFSYINPCGNNINVTQVIDIKPNLNFRLIQLVLINNIKKYFSMFYIQTLHKI